MVPNRAKHHIFNCLQMFCSVLNTPLVSVTSNLQTTFPGVLITPKLFHLSTEIRHKNNYMSRLNSISNRYFGCILSVLIFIDLKNTLSRLNSIERKSLKELTLSLSFSSSSLQRSIASMILSA